MTDKTPDAARDAETFDASFEGTRRRQLMAGLELAPEERLRWLERTMAELRRFYKAAAPPPHS